MVLEHHVEGTCGYIVYKIQVRGPNLSGRGAMFHSVKLKCDRTVTEEAALALDVGPQHKEVVGDIYLAVLISIPP